MNPPLPSPLEVPEDELLAEPSRQWHTVVWDDPVNLMSYVTHVFRVYLRLDEATATRLMLRVHHEGRAIVSGGSREAMEADVHALQLYGLWASLEQET